MRAGVTLFLMLLILSPQIASAELRVGATVTDITPVELPVLVNGGMVSRSISEVNTRLNARTIVIDDGKERIAISVVDSCMLPRPLLDDVKALTATRTGLRPDQILISATHTHSAPSSMGALGTDADDRYVAFLRERLVQSFVDAEAKLTPAKVGWGLGQAPDHTALRRWIRRPDRLAEDPFGNSTVRANMHSARNPDDVVGESGPEDPGLSLISFQTLEGRPLAVIANFSMHYFSDTALSADYFGLFSNGLKERLSPDDVDGQPAFVGMMSHGCSGDIWRRDYRKEIETGQPPDDFTIETFTNSLLDIAMQAYQRIEYEADVDVEMAETRMELKYRVPDAQRLQWAQQVVEEMGDRLPQTQPEIYAREQIFLHERQSTEIVVQGLRIGDIGIATTPNETYALTGLKIKLQSPLKQTMVIELANGGDGYIPPPEQHLLGGYNTWAARSAGLEVTAEPKIAAAALQLLQKVSGKSTIQYQESPGALAERTLKLKPLAYYRMADMSGPVAIDHSADGRHGTYEDGVAYFLDGPHSDAFCIDEVNRCAHFAGGRMASRLSDLPEEWTLSMWFWNGMPTDAREITGWMFSRGPNNVTPTEGVHLGLGGVSNHPGKLILFDGDSTAVSPNAIERWTWNHVVLVARADHYELYLNGHSRPDASLKRRHADGGPLLFLGGRCDNDSNWEGRLDEIAIFDRALPPDEVSQLSLND